MSRPKLRYALLDRALGAGLAPDAALRAGARVAIRRQLRGERSGGVEGRQRRLSELVAAMRTGPIAVATETANRQHYGLPPEFFGLFLGERRKYSGCLWPAGIATLEAAEEAMLALTAARAGIVDGARVLDLGCGWGAMSIWIAERYPAARVTAVSNSAPQRDWIEAEARRRGLGERIEVITADVNELRLDRRFDRAVSIEMFEHLGNWNEMLRRISGWLEPDGLAFIHVFSHRSLAYRYEDGWAAERFFTAGLMPSHDLLLHFQDDLAVRERWAVSGRHYAATLRAWLRRLDHARGRAEQILAAVHGDRRRGRIALANWRLFLLACAEIWGYRDGEEWMVSHYLLEPRA